MGYKLGLAIQTEDSGCRMLGLQDVGSMDEDLGFGLRVRVCGSSLGFRVAFAD